MAEASIDMAGSSTIEGGRERDRSDRGSSVSASKKRAHDCREPESSNTGHSHHRLSMRPHSDEHQAVMQEHIQADDTHLGSACAGDLDNHSGGMSHVSSPSTAECENSNPLVSGATLPQDTDHEPTTKLSADAPSESIVLNGTNTFAFREWLPDVGDGSYQSNSLSMRGHHGPLRGRRYYLELASFGAEQRARERHEDLKQAMWTLNKSFSQG